MDVYMLQVGNVLFVASRKLIRGSQSLFQLVKLSYSLLQMRKEKNKHADIQHDVFQMLYH